MKKITKKIICSSLALSLCLSLSACSGSVGTTGSANNDNFSEAIINTSGFSEGLEATKIDTVYNITPIESNVDSYCYKDENGMMGIRSYDGSFDSGAIYTSVSSTSKDYLSSEYFIVSKEEKSTTFASGLNIYSLTDSRGNVLIDGYADYTVLDNRYIKVYTAQNILASGNDDNALNHQLGNSDTELVPVGEGIAFSGVWGIYDLQKGCIVSNVSGTNQCLVNLCGNVLNYKSNDVEYNVNLNDGYLLPEGAELIDPEHNSNGSYYLVDGNGSATMYNSENERMFDFDYGVYTPIKQINEYYVFSVNNGQSYIISDKSFNILVENLSYVRDIIFDIVISRNEIYNLRTNSIIKQSDDSDDEFRFESTLNIHDFGFIVKYTINGKNGEILLDNSGNILLDSNANKHRHIESGTGALIKYDNDNYYYSYNSKSFSLTGTSLTGGSFTIYQRVDNEQRLVDLITNNILLENYIRYDAYRAKDCYHVFAKNNNGTVDIYKIGFKG